MGEVGSKGKACVCGIVGFVGEADPEALARMIARLAHRGPDDRGSSSQEGVHLGHTRLAVIDRIGGQQPMISSDGSLSLVFNGEIYRHGLLRGRLESAGHRFQTRSDTEVILEAYRAFGESCVDHLDGMFAFVIHDRARRRLFGARDRFGKKPLYYTLSRLGQVTFAFASEMTALLDHPAIRTRAKIDPLGIASYLLHDAPAWPKTIRTGIAQLGPGECFSLELSGNDASSLRRWRYFDLESLPTESTSPKRLAEAEQELLARLDEAVRVRLLADVPLGLFLSGGVDSSAILAFMARHRPAKEIPTFSIGFDDASFDESVYARRAADAVGSTHHHRLYRASDLSAQFDGVLGRLDEPLADPSLFPTAALSSLAREHVTVALSGEGGDELFAGYDPFRALKAAAMFRRWIPAGWRPTLASALRSIVPRSERNMSLDVKVDRFLRGVDAPLAIQSATWLGSFSLPAVRELMPDFRSELTPQTALGDVLDAFHRREGDSDVRRMLDFFKRFYLPNDILRKVDRASMWVGLEVRCPLLDTSLASLVAGFPDDWLLRGSQTKWILKRALRRGVDGRALVLPAILNRPKKGFGIPIARWLRTDLAGDVEEHLIRNWPASLEFLDREAVRSLAQEHLSRLRNAAKEVWSLLILARWVRIHDVK